jgi:hypothetical protein
MVIILLFILLLIIILIYLFINKKNNISVLSYVNINFDVPKSELLFLFIKKYNDNKYYNYMNKILELNLTMSPVYVIKKINNNYEYEIYFYRYNQHRQSKYNIKNANYLDISLADYNKTFITKNQMKELNINLYNNNLYNDNLKYIKYKKDNNLKFDKSTEKEFIIVSSSLDKTFAGIIAVELTFFISFSNILLFLFSYAIINEVLPVISI